MAFQSFPQDMQKIKATVVGNLYAYEVPAITPIPTMTAAEERGEKPPGSREVTPVNIGKLGRSLK